MSIFIYGCLKYTQYYYIYQGQKWNSHIFTPNNLMQIRALQITPCQSCSLKSITIQGQEYYAEGNSPDCNYPADPPREGPTAVIVKDPSQCTKIECRACPVGTRNEAESSSYCHRCTLPKEYSPDGINCQTCDVVG